MPDVDRKARISAFRRLFLGVVWDLSREARLVRRVGMRAARERMRDRHRRRARQFRETATRMGGVVIKLGQFLSARADVMPEEYLQELALLQDEVPAVPYEDVAVLVEAEFGRPIAEVFPRFEREPVAAASLGQVHHACLPDGTCVAVKVQRPGIEELCDIDLATFAWLMEGAHRFTRFGRRFDVPGLVAQFAQTLGDELDFVREGWHAERFRSAFARDPIIYVPKVHWDFTTDRVLTLELVEGIKISDYASIEEAGVDRHVVADEVFQSYMQQVLMDGFFHADPHPGNLFVVPLEDGPRITFVDFGMAGEITPGERELFKEAVIAGSRRDYDALVQSLTRLGFIRPGSSTEPIKRAIAFIFDHYSGITTHRVSYEALEQIQGDIRTLVYEQPFTLPSQFGFLGRAIGTMIGLVSGLDPQYDFVSAVRPYVRRATAVDPQFVLRAAAARVKEVLEAVSVLPERLDSIASQLKRGELTVRVQQAGALEARARASWDRIVGAFAIWAAALLVSGVVLYIMEAIDLAVAFWAASLAVMIIIAWPGRPKDRTD